MTRASVGIAFLPLAVFFAAGCSQTPPVPAKSSESAPAKILQFYASPATIARGDRTLLCYGVEGAASVRLDPPVDQIAPSRTRCIEAKPSASTKYTLYAKGRAGDEVSQQVEVIIDPKLAPSAPVSGGLILFFASSVQGKVPKGSPVSLCYGVKGASSVSMSPPVAGLVPSDRICVQVRPAATTNYVLTATSASGEKDSEAVRVVVE
jgi:hypothetical protein